MSMNKIIKKQLTKVREATIPDFDDNTTNLLIHKLGENHLRQNCYYQIKLENYIINEPENFTLSSNWNGGSKPTDFYMNVEIVKIMGKMIKVNGVGVNDGLLWEGWLPQKGFKIIKEL